MERLARLVSVAAFVLLAGCGRQPDRDQLPGDSGAEAAPPLRDGGAADAGTSDAGPTDFLPPVVTASPASGLYNSTQTVTLTCFDLESGCAAIHYTLDGSLPTFSSPQYQTPLRVSSSQRLLFFGTDKQGNVGALGLANYLIDSQAPITTADLDGGWYVSPRLVHLTCADEAGSGCVSTRFTVDGTPVTAAAALYTGQIAISQSTNLQFASMDLAQNVEPTRSLDIRIDPDAPRVTASLDGGTYSAATTVSLTCDDGPGIGCGAILASTDGGALEPVAGPLSLSRTTTLRFTASDLLGNSAPVTEALYLVDLTPPVTVASPDAGDYKSSPIQIVLSCSDLDESGCLSTHYTLDGAAPTQSSPVYSGPIALAGAATLRFFSVDRAGRSEPVQTLAYRADGTAPTTAADPAAGGYDAGIAISLLCADGVGGTGCAATYYTVDGGLPTTLSPAYSGPLAHAAGPLTLRFFSVDALGNPEAPRQVTYLVDPAPPTLTLSPSPGTYLSAQTVALTCDDGEGSGCERILFSTDAGAPAELYAAPLVLSQSSRLRAVAFDGLGNASAIVPGDYLIDLDAPTTRAFPDGGLYNANVSVQLSCDDGTGTGCAGTYYSTDGGAPSLSYAGPFSLTRNTTVRFHSVDDAGRTESTQTTSYEIDKTGPSTSANPGSGTYSAALGVTLSCVDVGSGCAATYFTLDGGTPGPGSFLFDRPIYVNANSTLRYVSKDRAGNLGAVGTASYTFDRVAPTVAATNPVNGEEDVSRTASISIFFDEPMEPTTLIAANFQLSPQVPLGRRSATADAIVLEPIGSLSADTRYTLTVTTELKDAAGNPLARPYSFSFTTVSIPVAISGNSSAKMVNTATAFAASGEGLALWSSLTGAGARLLYSRFDPSTRSWSTETSLLTAPGTLNPLAASLVSNGSDFMAVWTAPSSGLVARPFRDGGWQASSSLAAPNSTNADWFALASNGVGYAVTWRAYDFSSSSYNLFARVTDGGSWGPAVVVDSASGAVGQSRLTGHGTGYLAAWDQGGVWTSFFRNGSWEPAEQRSALGRVPSVASNGTQAAVAWSHSYGSQVVAQLHNGSSWSGDVRLDAAPTYSVQPPVLASNGTGFAALYSKSPIFDETNIYANVFDGAGWSGEALVFDGGVSNATLGLASSGSGYAAVWNEDRPVMGYAGSIYVSDWQGEWSPAVPVESSPLAADHPTVVTAPGGYWIAWDQNLSVRSQILTRFHDGGSLGPPGPTLVTGEWPGSASKPRVASTAPGMALAVWEQFHRGEQHVFASVRLNGTWGAPVDLGGDDSRDPDVATDGKGFMVVFSDRSSITARQNVSGVWLPSVSISPSGSAPRVTSNGDGYVAGWTSWDRAYGARFSEDTGWDTAEPVGPSGSTPDALRLASSADAHLAVWRQSTSAGISVLASRYAFDALAARFVWESPVDLGSTVDGYGTPTPEVASNGAGFAVVWQDGSAGRIRAAINDGTSWSAATDRGSTSGYGYVQPAIASDGAGYAILYRTNGYVSQAYSGGSWQMAYFAGPAPYAGPVGFASTGAGYKLLSQSSSGLFYRTFLGFWSGEQLMVSGSGFGGIHLSGTGGQYVGIWTRPSPTDPLVNQVETRVRF